MKTTNGLTLNSYNDLVNRLNFNPYKDFSEDVILDGEDVTLLHDMFEPLEFEVINEDNIDIATITLDKWVMTDREDDFGRPIMDADLIVNYL